MKWISIRPAEGGWMLTSDAVDNASFFRSGARAEGAALRLAQGLADIGEDARIEIYLRDGSLGRRLSIPAIAGARPQLALATADA